jgi:hypothetical protein
VPYLRVLSAGLGVVEGATNAMITESDIEVDVDLSLEIPCDHRQHDIYHLPDSPAFVMVRITRFCCNVPGRLMNLCRRGWENAGLYGVHCTRCGNEGEREDYWRVVQTY